MDIMNSRLLPKRFDAVKFLDFLFKILELFLGIRLVAPLLGLDVDRLIFNPIIFLTDPLYIPLSSFLPVFEFGLNGQVVLETATLIALIIVLFLDILSDIIIQFFGKSPASVSTKDSVKQDINQEVITMSEPVVPEDKHKILDQDIISPED